MTDLQVLSQLAPSAEEAKYDAILIYNSKNRIEAKKIHAELESRGLNIWIDYKHPRIKASLNKIIVEAVKKSKTAIILFGQEGVGAWQEDEIDLITDFQRREKLFLISVVLPGADEPTSQLGVTGHPYIFFTDGTDDLDALDELERTITGREPKHHRWPYEIHVPVVSIKNECFVACPFKEKSSRFDLITEAVRAAGLEAIQFQDSQKPNFITDLTEGIRSAKVVVVDCIPEENTNVPAPEMLYEWGLANALGKPTIVLIDQYRNPPFFTALIATKYLEYSLKNFNNQEFVNRLTQEIQSVLGELYYPFLTRYDPDDIYAIPSRVAFARIPILRHLRQILLFGITLHGVFREIAKHAHKLKRDMGRVDDDGQDIQQMGNLELHSRNWAVFNNTFSEDYCPAYDRFAKTYDELLEKQRRDMEKSFAFLSERLWSPKNNSNYRLKKLLEISQKNFDLAYQSVLTYLGHHTRLNKEISSLRITDPEFISKFPTVLNNQSFGEDGSIILTGNPEQESWLYLLCLGLSKQADRVNFYVNEMMMTLLEVVTEELNIGDDKDAFNSHD